MASMLQHFVRDLGGSVYVDLLLRPDASPAPTVTISSGDTAYVSAQTATFDSVNTTLGSAAARGALTVAVASASNIVTGRTYAVGGSTEPREQVRVRSISGTTITLARPLLYAHASGVGFVGTRLSYAVTSSQASALFFDGKIKWTWTESAVTKETNQAVECTRVFHERLASPDNLFSQMPKLAEILPKETDVDQLLQDCFDETLLALAPKWRVRTLIGSDAWVLPTVYLAASKIYAQCGAAWADTRDYYADQWRTSVERIQGTFPVDHNQDGTVDSYEEGGGYRSVPFARA